MSHHTRILCSCGQQLPPYSGRGPKPKYCADCKALADQRSREITNRENAVVADNLLRHITKIFRSKYQVLGLEECQSFFATLYDEIRRDQIDGTNRINVHFRRALTNKSKIKGQTFAMSFAAFSLTHRGLSLMEILRKKPKKGCLRNWDVLMANFATRERAAINKSAEQVPLRRDSAYAILMQGFKLPTKGKQAAEVFEPYSPPKPARYDDSAFIIEDDDDAVPTPVVKPQPNVRKLILNDIANKRNEGATWAVHIISRVMKLGDFEEQDVIDEASKLYTDDYITKNEWSCYVLTPKGIEMRAAA